MSGSKEHGVRLGLLGLFIRDQVTPLQQVVYFSVNLTVYFSVNLNALSPCCSSLSISLSVNLNASSPLLI